MTRIQNSTPPFIQIAVFSAIILAIGATSLVAQERQQAADPYQEALALFREGRYARAVDVVQRALETGGLGEHRASGWLLLAAAHLGVDAPQQAQGALDGLEREYPEGPYLLERRWHAVEKRHA